MDEKGSLEEASYLAQLSASETEFWAALWHSAPAVAFHELGIDAVRFGPVLAVCVAAEPTETALNFILGAGEARSVEHGHLGDAARWLESRCLELDGIPVDESGVDYRVSVIPGLPDSRAAEDFMKARGARRSEGPAKLIRGVSPPQFAQPPGIEVHDWNEWDDGFAGPLAESLGLPDMAEMFFCSLPEDESDAWACYCATDGTGPLAYAATRHHARVATVALGSRPSVGHEGAGQTAILHRCIRDAAAADCEMVVITSAGREPAVADRESMIQAGFRPTARSATWLSRVNVRA